MRSTSRRRPTPTRSTSAPSSSSSARRSATARSRRAASAARARPRRSSRTAPSLTWPQADLARGGQDSVPTNKLVMFLPGGVRDSLVKSADGVASETLYTKRLRAIYELIHGKTGPAGTPVGGLIEEGNKLEQKLQQVANKGKKFSFFM